MVKGKLLQNVSTILWFPDQYLIKKNTELINSIIVCDYIL